MKPLHLLTLLALFLSIGSCEKDVDEPDDTPTDGNGILFNPNLTYGSVTDVDGHVYKTIQIGNQVWMAQSLRVTHYRNGDPVTVYTSPTVWESMRAEGYGDYNNDTAISNVYGRLYNFYAVTDPRGLAPEGWHIPTIQEWEELIEYSGGYWDTTALALREAGNAHWGFMTPGNNRTGFTALGGGIRGWDGYFVGLKSWGNYWSSTDGIDYYDSDAYAVDISDGVGWNGGADKRNGFAVRCVKD